MFEPLNSQFSFFLLFRTLVGEKYCYRVQNIVLFQNLDQGVLEPNKFLTFLVHVVVSVRYVVRHRYRYLMQKFVNKIQTKRELLFQLWNYFPSPWKLQIHGTHWFSQFFNLKPEFDNY